MERGVGEGAGERWPAAFPCMAAEWGCTQELPYRFVRLRTGTGIALGLGVGSNKGLCSLFDGFAERDRFNDLGFGAPAKNPAADFVQIS